MVPKHISTLVVDSRPLRRAALAAALAAEEDLVVVAQAENTEALERACDLSPGVMCVGSMHEPRGTVMLCEQVKAERPNQPILVIDDAPDARHLLILVGAGVEGYVSCLTPLGEFVSGVRRVHDGEAVIPATMLLGLLRDLKTRGKQADETYSRYLRLTRRERQVLELLAEGCNNSTIADILVISPQTSRTHVQNVMRKLGAHSRLQVAAMAAEHGLLRIDHH